MGDRAAFASPLSASAFNLQSSVFYLCLRVFSCLFVANSSACFCSSVVKDL